jgi:glycyl-tRNA synthetase beta chain
LPESLEGAILAIADKVDTVVGIVGIGLLPTGSQDPYALRRHAQGIVQIAIAFGDRLRLSLEAITRQALERLAPKLTEPAEATHARVLEFLRARLATILTGRGARPDVVEAALASGFDEPRDAERRVHALTMLMQREDWEPLVVTFKRTINILPPDFRGEVDAARLTHDAERQLHAFTRRLRPVTSR